MANCDWMTHWKWLENFQRLSIFFVHKYRHFVEWFMIFHIRYVLQWQELYSSSFLYRFVRNVAVTVLVKMQFFTWNHFLYATVFFFSEKKINTLSEIEQEKMLKLIVYRENEPKRFNGSWLMEKAFFSHWTIFYPKKENIWILSFVKLKYKLSIAFMFHRFRWCETMQTWIFHHFVSFFFLSNKNKRECLPFGCLVFLFHGKWRALVQTECDCLTVKCISFSKCMCIFFQYTFANPSERNTKITSRTR